jgi:cardiolipin synthase A/B
MIELLYRIWPHVATALTLALALATSCHAVLYKRDTRAAIGWVGLIWLVPVVGSLLYIGLGINRIQRRARSLRGRGADERPPSEPLPADATEALGRTLSAEESHLQTLARLVADVAHRPLLAGNRVEPLTGDRHPYPVMLAAIERAERSISLSTYIFDDDRAGGLFLEALAAAVARGVQVRVLVDDVGASYSWPSIIGPLRRARVPVARFLPQLVPWAFRFANLRNHRKILVVDGRVGFTGGMNIREGHYAALHPRHGIEDLHFRIDGPAVAHLQEVFCEDWAFSTRERLEGEAWFPAIAPAGSVFARGISDGPDEDFEKLRWTLLGALACARCSVRIVTPYFLPDTGLITSLNVAALRGVEVDIVLPQKNNLKLVQWASAAQLWQLLGHGCRVWLSPPPFDHTKLMVVDGRWSLLGSSNWDPRSLRLNFEFNVECYEWELAHKLEKLIQQKLLAAQPVTLEDLDGRPLPVKLRDGVARLLSPYL